MSVLAVSILVLISIIAIIILTSTLKLNAFVSLFLVSVFLAFATLPGDTIVTSIRQGFGNTMASIGLLIIFGAMIGVILDRTGATLSIAGYMLSVTGEKNSPWALGITGFITGLPIFCDSGFIVLSGLTKSFSARSGMALPFMATVLATSLYSVHCLIPPHPGALAAAGIIDANIGNLIIAGILFAIPGALAAGAWAGFMVKGKNYPASVYSEGDFRRDKKDLPPVFLSFLPVVLPLLLITTRSLINLFDTEGAGLAARIFRFPGEPVFALAAGALSGLLLMRDRKISSLNEVFSEAIVKAGPILIVTAAGGMFGMIIAQTGAGESMGKLLADTNAGLLVPFLIALILKTAQGSSTVAIITAASLVLPMMNMLGLDSEWGRLLAMLSMGAGSMIVSHANDSYFWVVTNFSGIDIKAALRVYSTSTIVMGVVIFVLIWISSFILI